LDGSSSVFYCKTKIIDTSVGYDFELSPVGHISSFKEQ